MQHAAISRFYWVKVHIRKSVNWNEFIWPWSMDFTWLGKQICICVSENQSVSGVTTVCLMQRYTHLLRVELIRLLIVNCGILSYSSSMAMRSCWILAGNGTCCQYMSIQSIPNMGDMFGEYAGHGRTRTFSASRNCVQILAIWGCALSCWNTRWWQRMNGMTIGLRISSLYLCGFKLPSIKWNCVCCP